MKKVIILFLAATAMFSSCKKEDPIPEPKADFAFTGGGCTAPCAVLFENKSSNATTYLWDFGDGTTSTDANPTKTYNTGDTYTVKLTATGEGGSATVSKQVLVQKSTQSQLPSASFTFSGGGCMAPCVVSFTNTTTNATSYEWDFGDGSKSTDANPTHNYTAGGTYTVTLTATNASGNNQATKTVNIAAAATSAKITKVTLTDMPFVDGSGSGWDSNGPDVFFKITDMNDNVLLNGSSARVMDISPSDLPISWNLTTPFEINDLNAARYVDLWDYDSPDPDDLIGYVGFQLSDYTSGANAYPPTITLTQQGITYILNLTWQ